MCANEVRASDESMTPPIDCTTPVGYFNNNEEQEAFLSCSRADTDPMLSSQSSHYCEDHCRYLLQGSRFEQWGNFTKKYRHFIIAFWVVFAWPVGIYYSPQFIANTTMYFQPVPETPSYHACQVYQRTFGEEPSDKMYVVLDLAYPSGNLVDEDSKVSFAARQFVLNMTSSLEDLANQMLFQDTDYLRMRSYYTLEAEGMSKLAKHMFASSDGRTTVVEISYVIHSSIQDELAQAIKHIGNECVPDGISVSYTGGLLISDDVVIGISRDLEFMDHVIGPLTMLVLATVLGNLSIMVIPVLTLLTSILVGFAAMYPIALLLPVAKFTPLIMVATNIALSIDYCLFLLSRCTEEVAMGRDKSTAIGSMLVSSGHTVFVSGCLLCSFTLGNMLYPVKLIATAGIGISIAVSVTLLVNLSLVPALLHTSLGSFFLASNKVSCTKALTPGETKMVASNATSTRCNGHDAIETGCSELDDGSKSDDDEDATRMYSNLWFRTGKVLLTRWKGSLILLSVVAAILPIASFIPHMKLAMNNDLALPFDSPSLVTYRHLGEKIGYGLLSPFEIVFDGSASSSRIDNEETFALINDVLDALTGDAFPATPTMASYAGVTTIGGFVVPFAVYQRAIICGVDCSDEALKTIAVLAETTFNASDNMATRVYALLNVDAYSNEGIAWLVQARHTLSQLSEDGKLISLQVSISGAAGVVYDAYQALYRSLPLAALQTMSITALLMGLFFRSVLIPVLSIISISLTQVFVYGLAVLIYQYGILDFVGLNTNLSHDGLHWIAPIVSLFIVGLGLDYDVFLISRVLSYREQGFTHNSSILKALYKTRGVISSAGIIMAIALGGLLNSGTILLSQIGFFMVTAILMDTFLVRTVVLPILLGYFGRFTWWPRVLPPETKDVIK